MIRNYLAEHFRTIAEFFRLAATDPKIAENLWGFAHEHQAYRIWVKENNRKYGEFSRLKARDQESYWTWRGAVKQEFERLFTGVLRQR
jgi:hypothetical protein